MNNFIVRFNDCDGFSVRIKTLIACLCCSLLCLFALAVTAGAQIKAAPEKTFENEAWNNIDPEFIKKNSLGPGGESSMVDKKVRFIYLATQDRPPRADYKAALTDVALQLQDFYQKELDNNEAFLLNDPIVEVYQVDRPSAWFSTNPPVIDPNADPDVWFYYNSVREGFLKTGGAFNDPNNRWIFYVDAETACNQLIGGNGGFALMASNDLRGLTGQSNLNACGGNPDTYGKYRWIGGAGHEVAHAFNIPHPPGCGSQTGCVDGQTAYSSLMWAGYADYPNTYFLPLDKTSLLSFDFFNPIDLRPPRPNDHDADRKADIAVWRPSNGVWYVARSSDGQYNFTAFGASGDKIVPGDYDGDRKADLAIWRPDNGAWYVLKSANGTFSAEVFGLGDDIPQAADYDGDRITDIAIWRPSNGYWYINKSASRTTYTLGFGTNGDRPVAADFDGDKRTDIAVFRPGQNTWYIYQNYLSYYYYSFPVNSSQLTYKAVAYGVASDRQLPADYDGDGKADIAIWRPSSGAWYYLSSASGFSGGGTFGQNGDIPTPGDYDNDGKADFAIWRPSNGAWYISASSTGVPSVLTWGLSGDVPVQSAMVR